VESAFPLDLITVYFLYGLSFFSMGLAILLEVGRSSKLEFAWALRPLAVFGLVHGSHEWWEMFQLIHEHLQRSSWLLLVNAPLRILLLALSFLMLVLFGARLVAGRDRPRFRLALFLAVAAIWGGGLIWLGISRPMDATLMTAADVYTRYALAIPGAALTAWALALQQRRFVQAGMRAFGWDVVLAAVAFGLYGGIGQLFAAPSIIFPSQFVNSQVFLEWFGFPVQLFRGLMACMAAVFIVRSLRAFEEETRLQIEALREARLTEQRRLEVMRGELLRRTVRAQEDERQRIARELHDELGQTLTALGLGLRGIGAMVETRPEQISSQTRTLETLATNGLAGLQNLISGLHPPQLDDLGLSAALRWYTGEVSSRFGLDVRLVSRGEEPPRPPQMRIALYRIVQEAVTNIVRHAEAGSAVVRVDYGETALSILVEDDGRGFDAATLLRGGGSRPSWGLLGMRERVLLIGGELDIDSRPGQGTRVTVNVPLQRETGNG